MKFTVRDISSALNISVRSVQRKAAKERWPFDVMDRRGLQRLYPLSTLPEDIKAKIIEALKLDAAQPPTHTNDAALDPSLYKTSPGGFNSFSTPGGPPAVGGLTPPPAAPDNSGSAADAPDFQLASRDDRQKARMWERILRKSAEHAPGPRKTEAIDHFVAAYNAGHIDPDLLKESGTISRGNLYRKIKAYKKDGLSALLPRYKGRERDVHPDVQRKALAYFIERPRKIRRIYDYLRKDFPSEMIPSYRTIVRFLNTWAEEHPQEVCLAHWGDNKWKKRFLAAFGSASEEAPYPNHTWEIDATIADIMTTDNKRWKLVACVDVHSRLCPSITLQQKNNAWGVVQTLARGFEKYGIPERLRKDNGKDYASRWVSGFLRDLGVAFPKLPIKAPERKPHIERFFRDVSERLISELTGYTGNSLLNRPEEIRVNYTAEEFGKILQSWVENEFNEAAPATTGTVRRERFFAPGFRMRKVSKDELDVLVNPTYENKRVGKKGITFENKNYWSPELVGLIGKRVTFKLDINDISHVMVFTGKKFYCHAYDKSAAPWAMDRYLEEKRAHKKALKQAVRIEKELARGSVRDRMLQHLNEAEAAAPLRFPGPEEIINVLDLSEVPDKEPEAEDKPRSPYDEFPDRITELPWFDAWQNYEHLCKAEALGIPIAPEHLDWRDDYMNDRIEGFEGQWWSMYGRYVDDPTTAIPLFSEVERLKKIAANGGRL